MTIKLEEVTTAKYRTSTPVWIGPDGKAYSDDDKPDGSTLLAGVDGEITPEDAAKYGLAGKKASAPAEDKAVSVTVTKEAKAPVEHKAPRKTARKR